MHKKFFISTAIVLALAAGLTASAMAQRGGRFGRHGGMLKRMTRELNLTDAQQTQIKSIMTAEKAKIQPLRQQLRQNEQAENAGINGTFDQAQATAFAGKQSQIMSDLIVEKERARSQIYAVLTPDQRQKAQQLMQEHKQRWGKHRQNKLQPTQQTPEQ
jgi:Spy/CpxP family protein refolding chaperone